MSNATCEDEPLKLYINVDTSRDIEQTKPILGEWLTSQISGADGVEVLSLVKPTGNGGSSETYFTTIDVRLGKEHERREYVLRFKPHVFRMFLRENFDEQYRLITYLGRETDVPVPAIPFYEPDPSVLGLPFWLMEKVEGEVPSDQPPYNTTGFLFDATPEQRRKLWLSGLEAACKLPRLDVSRMPRIVDIAPGQSGHDENLRHWTEAMHWACKGEPTPLLAKAIDWLWANKPAREDTALSHGDCRIGNMIFRDWECVSVLDYDTITLAGPQLDLAHWLVMDDYYTTGFNLQPLEGIGDRQETIAQWEAFTGLKADQLEWHEVLAAFRLEINGVRGLSLLPEDVQKGLRFEDGGTVLSRQLERILARVAGI